MSATDDPTPGQPSLGAADIDALSARQRSFVDLFTGHPERQSDPALAAQDAAWRAGYCGGSEERPLPEDRVKRRALSQQAWKCRRNPTISAWLQAIDEDATAAFLATPGGERALRHAARVELGRRRAENLAAHNLAIITELAFHDPRSLVSWSDGGLEVRDSTELEYHEAILIQEVKHEEVFTEEGPKRTTTIKFAPRAPYVKMLEARVGKLAPTRVEHSGPGGGAIPHAHGAKAEVGPSDDDLDEIAVGVLGVVPAARAEEGGVTLEEVVESLKGWALDEDPHVTRPHELFEAVHWPETRGRYLVEDD